MFANSHGVLGAVIGCLAGAVIWSYIMGQGCITVFGGIIMIVLSFGGFIWFLNNNISVFSNYRSLSFAQKWQQTWGLSLCTLCCGAWKSRIL